MCLSHRRGGRLLPLSLYVRMGMQGGAAAAHGHRALPRPVGACPHRRGGPQPAHSEEDGKAARRGGWWAGGHLQKYLKHWGALPCGAAPRRLPHPHPPACLQPIMRLLGRAPPTTLLPIIDNVSGVIKPGGPVAAAHGSSLVFLTDMTGCRLGVPHAVAAASPCSPGIFTLLLGPPGSGKSTFLQTLAGRNAKRSALKVNILAFLCPEMT